MKNVLTNLTSKVEHSLTHYPCTESFLLGNFSVYHQHQQSSFFTDQAGEEIFNFAIRSDLQQLKRIFVLILWWRVLSPERKRLFYTLILKLDSLCSTHLRSRLQRWKGGSHKVPQPSIPSTHALRVIGWNHASSDIFWDSPKILSLKRSVNILPAPTPFVTFNIKPERSLNNLSYSLVSLLFHTFYFLYL